MDVSPARDYFIGLQSRIVAQLEPTGADQAAVGPLPPQRLVDPDAPETAGAAGDRTGGRVARAVPAGGGGLWALGQPP